jgi:GLPGLI family protein
MKIFNKKEVVLNNLYISKTKTITFLSFFLSISCMFSQNNSSGIVEYIVKNNDNFDVRKILDTPGLKGMPEKMKTKTMSAMMATGSFVLYFNANESIYKQKDSIEKMKLDTRSKRRPSFLKNFGGGLRKYYTNLQNKQLLVQEDSEVLEDKYIISYYFSKWKLLNETKKIGNYICYKAIKNDNKSDLEENKQTIVWYTPDISSRFGPKLYNGLPGLVLEVNRGQIVFLATKIILNPKETIIIKKPKKGIKIKYSDFKQKIIKAYERNGFKLE